MGSTSSQPESQPTADLQPRDTWKPIPLGMGGTVDIPLHSVVPAERYIEHLWVLLDKTLEYAECGIGSDTPVGMGGTLDLDKCTIVGAIAPEEPVKRAPGVPPPPEYLPDG